MKEKSNYYFLIFYLLFVILTFLIIVHMGIARVCAKGKDVYVLFYIVRWNILAINNVNGLK